MGNCFRHARIFGDWKIDPAVFEVSYNGGTGHEKDQQQEYEIYQGGQIYGAFLERRLRSLLVLRHQNT